MSLTRKQIQQILLKTDPFEILEPSVLESLAAHVMVRRYPAGTCIFRQGQASQDVLFILVDGLVEITLADDQGGQSVVGLRRPYDFFSETVVLSQQPYPGSARAREDAVCLLIKRIDLERLIYRYPEFSGFFNALLAERMRLLYQDMLAQAPVECAGGGETFWFRRRVGDLMSSPAITCDMSTPAADAARRMIAHGIGHLVVLDAGGRPRGVVTHRSLVRHIIADSRYGASSCKASQVMNAAVVTVTPGAFAGQALSAMLAGQSSCLVVVERGRPVGIVTLVDLVKTRSTRALVLLRRMGEYHRMADLATIGQQVDQVLGMLISENVDMHDMLEIMSRLHERMTRQVIRIAEDTMVKSGRGQPPVNYCWINMGSAARREQTLRTDQDNALIYADPPPDQAETVDAYFADLAEHVVAGLDRCGFQLCSGNVMATNSQWRRSLSRWQTAIADWTQSVDPQDVRILTILLDFQPVWGDFNLAEQFRGRVFSAFGDSLNAGHMLTRDDRHHSTAIGFLGNITTEKSGPHKNQLNLKTTAIVHIVNGLRLLALHSRIATANSLDRIDQLAAAGVLNAEEADFFGTGFETLMMFRIRENYQKFIQGLPPDNYIDPRTLRKRELILLKDALAAVTQLQKLIHRRFNVAWMRFFS